MTVAVGLLAPAPAAQANLVRGIVSILGGVLEVPRAVLIGTVTGPPVIGTAVGAVSGTIRAIGMIVGGTLETVFSLIPLAKKYGPLAPIFL